MSAITCAAWGYLLCNNNLNTLWRMLGISNQLLACIALAVGTTFILTHSARRVYALCTGIPFALVIVTVVTASYQSIAGWWRQIGAADANQALQLRLMCGLGAMMVVFTLAITADAVRRWIVLLRPISRYDRDATSVDLARVGADGAAGGGDGK